MWYLGIVSYPHCELDEVQYKSKESDLSLSLIPWKFDQYINICLLTFKIFRVLKIFKMFSEECAKIVTMTF